MGQIQRTSSSVADPDPNPDPQVFRPPGSGSISQRYGSGSFHHYAKIIRKPLISTVFLLFYFLSLKNDVNVPSKSNMQKNRISFLIPYLRSQTHISESLFGVRDSGTGMGKNPDQVSGVNTLVLQHRLEWSVLRIRDPR
jgi:hypothetical protein